MAKREAARPVAKVAKRAAAKPGEARGAVSKVAERAEVAKVAKRAAPAPKAKRVASVPRFLVPRGEDTAEVSIEGKALRLTHLHKMFFPEAGLTKADLLQYYADIAPVLLPHIRRRAMVMKRYPGGINGEFFFMKRAPSPRPDFITTCRIQHGAHLVDFPCIDDLASLLWVINLGCVDLNPWYGRCDDADKPDYLHFDLDPFEGATWEAVVETAQILRVALEALALPTYVKTTGSKGLHVYVPIERGPSQREVWTFAKTLGTLVAGEHPDLMTVKYRISTRPKQRVLVDYNQNASGRTLASIYSVRPRPRATVSTPVTWDELEAGVTIDDFRIDNVPARVAERGDLWAGVLAASGRADLSRFPIPGG